MSMTVLAVEGNSSVIPLPGLPVLILDSLDMLVKHRQFVSN